MRRAVRVAAVACVGFYVCYYLVDDPVMATYALFAAVAMGFLSQIPGPAVRRSVTLLWSLPVALLLVTVGTLLAGNLWAATAGMLVFGFLIAYAGVGGPRLVGLTAGMQLFFILPCFPPYAPDTLTSRLFGVCVGLGLLAFAEWTLWPDRGAVSYQALLANACERLADHLTIRATGDPDASAATLAAVAWPAEAMWPSHLPPAARPASAEPTRPGPQRRGQCAALSCLPGCATCRPGWPRRTGSPSCWTRPPAPPQATAQALRGAPAPRHRRARGRHLGRADELAASDPCLRIPTRHG